jgi:hypothetical protein
MKHDTISVVESYLLVHNSVTELNKLCIIGSDRRCHK